MSSRLDIALKLLPEAPSEPFLDQLVFLSEYALRFVDINEGELSLYITDDKEIRELNLRYRNIDKATNVLSFPLLDDESDFLESEKLLGDLVISYETARRESEAENISYKEKIYRLIIHGILHIAGYDHEMSDDDFDIFTDLEEKIFLSFKERLL